MAAGLGSRFGGPKQLEPFGPGGQTLIDYAIFDARCAGFGQVVLVASEATSELLGERIVDPWRDKIGIEIVLQKLDDLPAEHTLPPSRSKPWGTGHAALAARDHVDGPFVLLNADDFYGRQAYVTMATFLGAQEPGASIGAMPGYELAGTLPKTGAVSRALCRTDENGFLESVEEHLEIQAGDPSAISRDTAGNEHQLADDCIVSMNFWGLPPSIFERLANGFAEFLAAEGANPKSEFVIPGILQRLIDRGDIRIKVLPPVGACFGVTHAGDREIVRARLQELHEQSLYPEDLRS